ncbi:HAMP domain-containing histidine kinase [Paenibacillus mesophilus]|uniref:HAMP domain-containing sensor histidine kinase n=1 Tax=Paenibacillus mesophilus TaxID=2582849 RepID=UPI00110DC0CE|nr:HAMP domain-containing histidine kinase [Paenibacillus mesophilus]TMV50109.1 HAMP domain-containing histidine kinase [Paenibacillus mesophilus]
MRKLFSAVHQLPIKWKLTIWSSLLLFLLFAAYNAVQYTFIEKWMIQQEKIGTRQNMNEILNYFLENEFSFKESDMPYIRGFLEKVNHQNQSIRVLDDKGRPIVVVSNRVPNEWIDGDPLSAPEKTGGLYFKDRLLIMRSPLTIFEFNGTVEIVKNNEDFVQLINAFSRVMLVCGFGAIIISGVGGRLLARQLLKPLQSMADAIRKIKQKGLHERVLVNNNHDEISTLMKMFNEMMDQVERSFQQQRQFVEDASHELRTPIAIIEGHLSLLQRWGKKDPAILEESLDISIQELARLKGLVQELLALTRAEEQTTGEGVRKAKPDQVVLHVMKHIAAVYPSFQLETELVPLTGTMIEISEGHLEQIMLIVLDNAMKYSMENKRIRIKGSVLDRHASIEITDSGIGIPETDLPYVMDRFYRVDKARSREQGGNGLGLSIAKRLVERYNGAISIRSKENEGTTVTVSFPVLPP